MDSSTAEARLPKKMLRALHRASSVVWYRSVVCWGVTKLLATPDLDATVVAVAAVDGRLRWVRVRALALKRQHCRYAYLALRSLRRPHWRASGKLSVLARLQRMPLRMGTDGERA